MFLGTEVNNTCPYHIEVGDGWCDEKANVKECLYDGLDCCKPGKELMPNAHQFCQDCSCHKKGLMAKRRKPGLCEICIFPFLDNPETDHFELSVKKLFFSFSFATKQ